MATQAPVKGSVYIGHAGWSYPAWRKGVWFPNGLKQSEELRYYASKLHSTEVNNTFYNLPSESTFKEWRDSTPAEFQFSLKMSQWVTHQQLLATDSVAESFPKFQAHSSLLKNKLGVILVQLPPTFAKSLDKLQGLATVFPPDWRFAFEFRHQSWFCDEVYDELRKHNWALVLVSHATYVLCTLLILLQFPTHSCESSVIVKLC
eukprot:TRINITY_DN2538_c0_g1_i3.p1 TRINITY_DN2538_c0_g1~~TRINITY_DN2538_c0_g1_i3.p1  ORF type:complete len:212 (+),score=13.48 TRINITY_DN2538_c0_g1_i3:27-638(+)